MGRKVKNVSCMVNHQVVQEKSICFLFKLAAILVTFFIIERAKLKTWTLEW